MKSSRLVLMAGMFLLACQPTLQDIDYGRDQCAYCKMIISDPRFGAEAVTDKGKVYKFDALECLIPELNQKEDYQILAAVVCDEPRVLHDVSELSYLISAELPSPMGANLTSYSSAQKAQEMQQIHGGTIYSWDELVEKVRNP